MPSSTCSKAAASDQAGLVEQDPDPAPELRARSPALGPIQRLGFVDGEPWAAPATIGRGTAFGSFREVLGLDVATSTVARAMWKSTPRSGTEFDASNYRP